MPGKHNPTIDSDRASYNSQEATRKNAFKAQQLIMAKFAVLFTKKGKKSPYLCHFLPQK
jgi:hypothetical protein